MWILGLELLGYIKQYNGSRGLLETGLDLLLLEVDMGC